jgi:hypothetical protein
MLLRTLSESFASDLIERIKPEISRRRAIASAV